MTLNLLLRFLWVMNVSNVSNNNLFSILHLPINSANLSLILNCIEMVRRIIWNLLRVEYQHI